MKEISISEYKVLMTQILVEVDAFCRSNNLKYHLAYGSLLGAIRHSGFIPWDDDIDIWMPRPDYEFLKHNFKHEYYQFISSDTQSGYPLDYAKVQDTRTIVLEEGGDGNWGFFIDIFPLDGLPSISQGEKMFNKARFIRRIAANQRFTYKHKISFSVPFVKNAAALLGKTIHPFIKLSTILNYLDKTNQKYSYVQCDYCGDLCNKTRIYKKGLVEPTVDVKFEGYNIMVPQHYHEILTIVYGDYMTLPPVEKRVSKHGIKAYWKES